MNKLTLEFLYQKVRDTETRRIVVADGNDPDVLMALYQAFKEGFARVILVGDKSAMESKAREVDVPLSGFEIEVAPMEEIAERSVTLIREGQGDLLMKGHLSTAELLKAVLNKEKGLRSGQLLSHLAITEIPERTGLLFFTDGGINIEQTVEVKEQITLNAIRTAQSLGVSEPQVALLTLVENVNEKLSETVVASEVCKHLSRMRNLNAIVEGPIALDVALSRKAAEKKGLSSRIAGETDILVGANITATNHIVKALLELGKARVGGIIVGAKVPIILLSRSDSSQTKLDSIICALALS